MKKNYTLSATICALWIVAWTWKYGSSDLRENVTLQVQDIQAWKQVSRAKIIQSWLDPIDWFLSVHPGLLPLFERSSWWQKYQEWSLDGESTILHIDSLKRLEKFQIDYPDLYEKFTHHPLWWKAWMYDEHSPEQDEALIENVISRLEYLDDNPQIMNILRQLWYEKDQLFSSSWQDKESIYIVLSDLNEIMSSADISEVSLFLQSDAWKIFLKERAGLTLFIEAFEIFRRGKV